jgi:hypothetical protein
MARGASAFCWVRMAMRCSSVRWGLRLTGGTTGNGKVRRKFRRGAIYPPPKRAWWRMSSAMTYSFWGLGMLAIGGIVLATLVW